MNLNRIKTIITYAYYHLTHSMETWVDLIWFPIIEILVFGILANYLDQGTGQITKLILLGLITWEVVRVIQYSITVGMMWDIWSDCFSSLFISPLTMAEFILGHTLAGVVKSFLVLILLSVLAFLLYGFSMFVLGPAFLVYFALLSIFSVSAGIFTLSLVIKFGTDVQSLSWSLIYLFQPISAVLYPVSVLPAQFRWVAFLSPITYVMESARTQAVGGSVNWGYLGISLLLNLFYLSLVSLYLKRVKAQAQQSGAFARMEM